jgi:predicted  nucleic acid-binding Zn-ribbon protein
MGKTIQIEPETTTKNFADELTAMEGKITRLLTDISQRQSTTEGDLRLLAKERDAQIAELRDQYDSCLNRGDKSGAEKVLDRIAELRGQLVTLCKNVESWSDDFTDLEQRAETLRLEMLALIERIRTNFFEARDLDMKAVSEMGRITHSAISNLRELKETIEKAKKAAQQILSE